MALERRLGVKDTKARTQLVDAADALLSEEGFQAISARRVAERAGLKPQLVHYYFRTMDDLVITVFRRATEQYLEQHERALAEPQPLRALWKLNTNPADTKRIMEFIAVGSHREGLRAEISRSGEHFRTLQIGVVTRAFAAQGIDEAMFPPAAIVMLMAAISRALVMEKTLGITMAHDELRGMMGRFLDRVEPLAP
jgi:AcrR family transcriptional regulator